MYFLGGGGGAANFLEGALQHSSLSLFIRGPLAFFCVSDFICYYFEGFGFLSLQGPTSGGVKQGRFVILRFPSFCNL